MRASARRWIQRREIGLIGAETDLTYPLTHLGTGPAAVRRWRRNFRAARREKPMVIVGPGRPDPADGAAVLAAAWGIASRTGALTADWHGFNVLHTAAARVGGLDLGFVPGPNGRRVEAMLDLDRAVSAWRRRTRHGEDRRRNVRDLSGPSRRRRCGARRCHSARRRLYRKVRHLCQHRGPGAARLHGDASARRGARRLAIIRALSARARPYPAVRYDRSAAARLAQVNPVFGHVGFLPRFGCSDTTGPAGDPAAVSDAPFAPPITTLSPDRSDQPRQPDHGGLHRRAGAALRAGGGIAR